MESAIPPRPRSTLFWILLLWVAFYASFALFFPPLLDDADSVHAEVAREMLLRHDYVTLYANGIRYLEKAPLLYWSMAASMRLSQVIGYTSPRALAAAARLPIALDVLGLALLTEALARAIFRSSRAGLYAALITLSSFGIFLFTRTTIPDAGVCLWLTLAMLAFYRTEQTVLPSRIQCILFAAACALNVLTKGLIGLVFPLAIVLLYLLLTRGLRGAAARLRQLHLLTSLAVFLVIAAPWHILAGLANPTQGHPAPFLFVNHHWQVPLPTDGNVRGWFWFYFMNEHLLRYLNLRIPHDYDTSPLWLFWGLCLLWIFPWSAFLFHAAYRALPWRSDVWRKQFGLNGVPILKRGQLVLVVWSAFVLVFFSLSTRQEYYVLPAIPALAILIAGWLELEARSGRLSVKRLSSLRITTVLLAIGALILIASLYFLLKIPAAAPNTDLATLLNQNPADYALSLGHFLDITGPSIALFELPLSIAALSLFLGPLISLILRRRAQPHGANLALAAGAFGFLLSVHLGLQVFAPVLTSAQLAQGIAPQIQPRDLLVIHGEYESGSSLAFYLQRPATPGQEIHILEGRSSNLWYGSFFPDAPDIFETSESLAAKWSTPQRIFLWQSVSLPDAPENLPPLPNPVYILVKSGGKEMLSNQPNR